MDLMIRMGIVVIVLIILAAVMVSSGVDSTPSPTPTPVLDSSVELVRAVGDIVDPLITVAAGAVAKDTLTAHPEPRPSVLEVVSLPLALFGSVCVLAGFPSLALIAWVLARNSETVARAQAEALVRSAGAKAAE